MWANNGCFTSTFRLLAGSWHSFDIKAQWPIRRLPLRLLSRISVLRPWLHEVQNGRQHRLHFMDGVRSSGYKYFNLHNPHLYSVHDDGSGSCCKVLRITGGQDVGQSIFTAAKICPCYIARFRVPSRLQRNAALKSQTHPVQLLIKAKYHCNHLLVHTTVWK